MVSSMDNGTLNEFRSIETLVRDFLRTDERCRNDDKWLTYCVFQKIAQENNQAIFIPFELFGKFPAFETIKRTCAKIQNVFKEFRATDPAVLKKRCRREDEVKTYVKDGVVIDG